MSKEKLLKAVAEKKVQMELCKKILKE